MTERAEDNVIHVSGWNSPAATTAPLHGGGGGGTYNGMEARVAKLEASAEHMQKDLGLLQSDVRKIYDEISAKDGLRDRLTIVQTGLSHLPTKGFTLSTALAALALLSAVFILQGNIQKFLGVSASGSSQQSNASVPSTPAAGQQSPKVP